MSSLLAITYLFFDYILGPKNLSRSLTFVCEVSTPSIAKVFRRVFCYIDKTSNFLHMVSPIFLACELVCTLKVASFRKFFIDLERCSPALLIMSVIVPGKLICGFESINNKMKRMPLKSQGFCPSR